jgi:hypothetical protein
LELWITCGELPDLTIEKVCVSWVRLWITFARPVPCLISTRNSRRSARPGPEAAAQDSDLNRKALALPVETLWERVGDRPSIEFSDGKPDGGLFPDHQAE